MMKNCPGKKGLSSFRDQFCESKTDPFAQANSDRACFRIVCVEKRWLPTIERVIGLGAAPF